MNLHRWNPFLRFPRTALLLFLLVCIPALLRLPYFSVNSETRVLLEGDQRNLASYEEVKRILADTEVLVVSLEVPDLFSNDGLNSVRMVSEALARQPGVLDVKSLSHSSKPIRRGLTFELVPLVSRGPLSPPELAELKEFCLTHPLVRNLMVSEDGRHTLILVTYRRDLSTPMNQSRLRREIHEILTPLRERGLKFQLLSWSLIETEIRESLRRDVTVMVPAALGALFVVFLVTFRSWPVVLLIWLTEAMGLLLVPVLIAGLGYSMTIFSVMLLPLLGGVQLTFLAHIYTSIQQQYAKGLSGDQAVDSMLNEVFKSCAFAAITTIIGLLSLACTEVRTVREFGWLGTVGTVLIFFIPFGPGLALIQCVARSRLASAVFARSSLPSWSKPGDDWANRLVRLTVDRPGTVTLVSLFLVAGSVLGMMRVRTDIRAVEFLGADSPTRKAVQDFDRIYGGINVLQLEFDTEVAEGINQRAFLEYLDRVQHFAEQRAGFSGVYSYSQLMAMMNQIWEGGRPQALKLPDNQLLVGLFATALKSYEFPFLTALADPKFRIGYLVLRSRDLPVDRYLAAVDEVSAFAQKHKPSGVNVSAAKGIHAILEADRRIVRAQVNTAGLTLLLVAVPLICLWRSLWLAGAALLINAIPICLVVALAGYADIPLNSITIMVAAVSFGIAMDDSVHVITYFRDLLRQGLTAREAVLETYRVKARAVVVTSFALMVICLVFGFSSFPPVIHFGLLSVFAFGTALLSVLTLLPPLLTWIPLGRKVR